MLKAEGLKKGDSLGLIAPASPITDIERENAVEALENLGFKVKLGETCFEKYGYLAGDKEFRAEELNKMFLDKEIKGIICIRGGYGSGQILDYLDYQAIKENPKVFIGYSDITALHLAINQKTGLVTFQGPMALSDLTVDKTDFTLTSFKSSLYSGAYQQFLENPPTDEIEIISEGFASGKIIGGNLCLISSLMGTDYEIDTKDKILYLEEVGEQPYNIDRMLNQLDLAGKFKDAKGVILGDFKNCYHRAWDEYPETLSLREVFDNYFKELDKPVIFNLKSGHCNPKLTLPIGLNIELNTREKYIKLLENPVK